jgi:hypothetical protein
MLPKLPGLGVWRLESKGWNAAATMPATLDMLGAIAPNTWVPAVLRIQRQSSKKRDAQGKPETRRFIVPVIDLVHGTVGGLLDASVPVVTTAQIGEGRSERVARPELPAGPRLPAPVDFGGSAVVEETPRPAIRAVGPDGSDDDGTGSDVHDGSGLVVDVDQPPHAAEQATLRRLAHTRGGTSDVCGADPREHPQGAAMDLSDVCQLTPGHGGRIHRSRQGTWPVASSTVLQAPPAGDHE